MFALHAQPIGNAVDVIEEADDLRGIVNGGIVPAGSAQLLYIRRIHGGWLQGEFFGISAEGAVSFVQLCRAPIADDGMHQGVGGCVGQVGDLGTEVMRM